ncbi:hypothetical protein LCGC14_0514910 [marine sediment metagenome]|uniref:Phage terminase large subunit N-terminal domain-containing protein n=1 Tax=marine sediment metagenome TaxID=412755 RepID=A0A0F9S041_9ZZZZ|nr:hypothetical protein [Candidatus Aminicenantes bacterium]
MDLSIEKYNKLKPDKKKEFRQMVKDKLVEVQSIDPFWSFVPTTGELTPEMKDFLGRYLKPEDIPEKVDGQLDSLLDDSDILGVSGGNQSGKSAVGAVDGYISHTGELPDALLPYEKKFAWKLERARKKYMMGRVVGVDGKQLRNTVLPSWKQWCPRKYLKNGSWDDSFTAQYGILELYRHNKKKCGQIEFMTNEMDVESFQGPPLDWIKYDEEARLKIFKENMLRFVTSDKVDVRMYWTPTQGLTWSADLFQDGIIEDKLLDYSINLYKLCTVTNPKANLKTVATILSTITDYNELKMRLLGEFISIVGLIYGQSFQRGLHVIEPFKIKHDEHMVVRGLDPHTAKPTMCVELAVDRMMNEFVCGLYQNDVDTEIVKYELAQRAKAKNYRLAWTQCDKSANTTNKALSDRNIFKELSQGKDAIPGLFPSEKYTGSIHAGVDEIKKLLKPRELTSGEEKFLLKYPEMKKSIVDKKKPRLFIFDLPECRPLIRAMQSLEREAYPNEDKKGMKDQINEGKHDAHAALRYIHQRRIRWMPPVEVKPHYEDEGDYV